MSVVIHREPLEMGDVLENCCFCRRPTEYWVTNKDVACCLSCASRAEPEDVPDKKTWLRREHIATPPCVGRL